MWNRLIDRQHLAFLKICTQLICSRSVKSPYIKIHLSCGGKGYAAIDRTVFAFQLIEIIGFSGPSVFWIHILSAWSALQRISLGYDRLIFNRELFNIFFQFENFNIEDFLYPKKEYEQLPNRCRRLRFECRVFLFLNVSDFLTELKVWHRYTDNLSIYLYLWQ